MDALKVTLDLRVPPAAVIQALQSELCDRPESAIPPALRAAGVLDVNARVTGHRVELWYTGGEGRGGTVRLKGVIHATASGAVINARVTRVSTAMPAAVALACIGLLIILEGDRHGWPALVLAGALAAIGYFQTRTIPDWMEPRARFLLVRLHNALDAAAGVNVTKGFG